MEYLRNKDIENMNDCELVAGLMQGQKSSFKVGYSALNAVYAVKQMRADADEIWLRFFAAGFAAGMRATDTIPGPDDMPLDGSGEPAQLMGGSNGLT